MNNENDGRETDEQYPQHTRSFLCMTCCEVSRIPYERDAEGRLIPIPKEKRGWCLNPRCPDKKIARLRTRVTELSAALEKAPCWCHYGEETTEICDRCKALGLDQGTSPLHCLECGRPHRLTDLDAGTEREMYRLCWDCYTFKKGRAT